VGDERSIYELVEGSREEGAMREKGRGGKKRERPDERRWRARSSRLSLFAVSAEATTKGGSDP